MEISLPNVSGKGKKAQAITPITEVLLPPPDSGAGPIPAISLTNAQMIDLVSTYPVEKMPTNKMPAFSDSAIWQVYTQVALTNRVAVRSAAVGVHQLLRKGAANSGAPSSLGVEVYCPDTNRTVVLTKGELVMFICKCDGFNKDDKNVCRTFAESVAVVACTSAQNQIASKRVPLELLGGDLFAKINRALILAKEPKLTSLEAVWCCSYCQNIPNLNELAGSERLEQLLTKDLEQRLVANKKRTIGEANKGTKRGESPQKAKASAKAKAKSQSGIAPNFTGFYEESKNPNVR